MYSLYNDILFCYRILDGLASLIADPSGWNSTANQSVKGALTFEPIIQLLNVPGFRMSQTCEI